MKYFDFELLGIKRKLPFVKVAGRLALASFVVISDTELVKAAAPELVKRLPEVDLLLTAEAKSPFPVFILTGSQITPVP